jgi:hypothetical protein
MTAHRAMTLARRHLGLAQLQVKKTVVVAAAANALGLKCPKGKQARDAILHQYCRAFVKRPVLQASYAPPKPKPFFLVDPFLESYEWRRLRMQVLTKRGARCECCGATPRDGVRMNVDHIKPRRYFPELALVESNLQILCDACNHGKGNWDQTDWRAESRSRS